MNRNTKFKRKQMCIINQKTNKQTHTHTHKNKKKGIWIERSAVITNCKKIAYRNYVRKRKMKCDEKGLNN